MKKAVIFFLLATPMFYSGLLAVTDIREQQLWVMLIGAAFFVGLTHYNRIVGYGVLYCLAHLALFQRPAYLNNMVQILAHVIVYDCVAKHYRGDGYKWPILAVLSLNLVMAALQYFRQDVYLHMDLQSPGLMTLPVYIGIYAAVTAPIIYGIHPALILLSIAGVVVSRSSFAAVALVAAMTFYLWRTRSRLVWGWVSVCLLALIWFVGVYDGPTGQFSRRVHIWKMVGSAIAVNPWGGWGLGAYDRHIRFVEIGNGEHTREYAMYQPHKAEQIEALTDRIEQVAVNEFGYEKAKELYEMDGLGKTVEWFRKSGSDIYFWQDPHNLILLTWFELGLPMILLMAWYCWDIWVRFEFWRKTQYLPRWVPDSANMKNFSCFIAVCIVSLAHFAIQLPRLSFSIMVILAILDQRLKPIPEEV